MKFKIFGSNANGLKGKVDSLIAAIKFHNYPSCITIQESKLRSKKFEIPGYQVFLQNRDGFGGGLVTAIDENLASVLISTSGSEILVVQVRLGHRDIRIINGYGPQENENVQTIFEFWQNLEKEILAAKEQNCSIIIQLDANAKIGSEI